MFDVLDTTPFLRCPPPYKIEPHIASSLSSSSSLLHLSPSTGLSEEEAARTYDAFLQRQVPTKYTQYANFCPTCDLFRRPEKEGRKGVKDQRVVVSQGKRYTPCSCALSFHSHLSKKQRGDKGGKNGRKGAGKIKRPSKIEYSHYRHGGEGERGGMTALHLDTAFEHVFGDDNHNDEMLQEKVGTSDEMWQELFHHGTKQLFHQR